MIAFSPQNSSLRFESLANHCRALLCHRIAAHAFALLSKSAATQAVSLPLRSRSVPSDAPPLHLPAMHHLFQPMLCQSPTRQRFALPPPNHALPMLINATQFYSNAAHCTAVLAYALPVSGLLLLPMQVLLCRSFAILAGQCLPSRCHLSVSIARCALPGYTLPLRHLSIPGHPRHAVAYLISSHSNRPLPALRHWPMPRNTP